MAGGYFLHLAARHATGFGDLQQSPDVLNGKPQLARPADKRKPSHVHRCVVAMTALGTPGLRHEADPLVVADGFKVDPGAVGELADGQFFHGRRSPCTRSTYRW